MTKESRILLITAATLFGMATLSIASAFDGRISLDDHPDAMVTQLYAPNIGTNDLQEARLDSKVSPSDHQIPR